MKSIELTKKLNERSSIPLLGMGTAGLKGKTLIDILTKAYDIGYRHFDTADYYVNHDDIGIWFDKSGINRSSLFVTSKVWKDDLAPENVESMVSRSLDELRMNYIDLLLVHAPNDEIPISETLSAMKEQIDKHRVQSIGLSNFNIRQFEEVLEAQRHWKSDFKIVNHQIKYNPLEMNSELAQFCFDKGISVTAYSPLANGDAIDNYVIIRMTEKYEKTESQLILRWLIQQGFIVIPKSSNPKHLEENADIFDWDIEPDDIDKLNRVEELDVNPSDYLTF